MSAVAVTGTVMMTADEARECVAKIKAGLEGIAERLMQLRDCRGWEALGYKTWQECIKHEFQMSRQRAHQLINAAAVERVLAALPPGPASTMVDASKLNERQRRELVPIADQPERVAAVIERAVEKSGGKPTAKVLRGEVSQEIGRPERTRPPLSSKAEASDFDDIPDELVLAGNDVPDLGIQDSTGEAWTRTSSTGQRCGQCNDPIPAGEVCHCMDQPADAPLTDRVAEAGDEPDPSLGVSDADGPSHTAASPPPTVTPSDRPAAAEPVAPTPPAAPADPYDEGDPFDGLTPHPDGMSAPLGPDSSLLNNAQLDDGREDEGRPAGAGTEERGKSNGHTGFSEGVGGKAKGGSHGDRARVYSPDPITAGGAARMLLDFSADKVVAELVENATAEQLRAIREALAGTAQPASTPPAKADLRTALADDRTILEIASAITAAVTVDGRASLLAVLADAMPTERLAPLAHRLNVRLRPESNGSGVTVASVKLLIREHLSAADIKSLEWELPQIRKEIGQRERAAVGAR